MIDEDSIGNIRRPGEQPAALVDPNNQGYDDDGLDEAERYAAAIALRDVEIPGCLGATDAALGPPTALTIDAARPPADGFFAEDAAFLGAVRDVHDDWPSAPWTRWD